MLLQELELPEDLNLDDAKADGGGEEEGGEEAPDAAQQQQQPEAFKEQPTPDEQVRRDPGGGVPSGQCCQLNAFVLPYTACTWRKRHIACTKSAVSPFATLLMAEIC